MFQDIVQRQTDVTCEHKKDLEAIDLIYGKKNVEARRKLLLDYDPKLYEMVQIGNKMTFE